VGEPRPCDCCRMGSDGDDGRSAADRLTVRQRWIMVAASLAVGLAFLDETAAVTALPTIQREFNATSAEMQWVMGSYLLALASLMVAAGRLADIFGRRRLFLIGAAVFGAGSIACAAAPDEGLLIAARAVQGAGGALLIPLGMANATAALPEERRGWTIGIVSTGATVFLALGPLVGGTLVEAASWRWIFLINLPVIAATMMIALRSFPETRGDEGVQLDMRGLVLLVVGLVAVVTALLNVQDWGIRGPVTLAVLSGGLGLLVAFVVVERQVTQPLIDLALLRIPAVTGALFALFAIQFAILGLTVYLTLYLQRVLGYSPAAAGALALPTVVMAPLLAGSVGRLTDRIGARWLLTLSLLLAALALVSIGLLADQREALLLLPAFMVFGVARPVATVAGSAGVVGAIPRKARGLASALVTQARQLGAVLGVAVLGLLLTGLELSRRSDLLRGVDSTFDHREREALDGVLAGSSQGQALLQSLGRVDQRAAREAAAASFVTGFRGAMLAAALLALAAAAASWLLLRPPRELPAA
jgi:EmrB/QacA subfamily drug resistance transporter